jgi:hypothetical protein
MPRDEGGENDEGKNDHHGHDYGARCASGGVTLRFSGLRRVCEAGTK